MGRRGHKARFVETCETNRPHIIVRAATTAATLADVETIPADHADLAEVDLLSGQELVDAVHTSVDGIINDAAEQDIDLVGPLPSDPDRTA
ncbi:hypothetical protein [Streptomyces sp. NPDC058683]|uniref:hypothetical protein n=1 Tax=Streptomyces sp. NPDC058683 TaxID=3346597 RepID=UPI00364F8C4D